MDWMQCIVIMGSIIGTILGVIIPLQIQTNNRLDAIHQEMKDFHGRMCAIEERTRNKS